MNVAANHVTRAKLVTITPIFLALLFVHPAASLANPVGFTPIPDDSVGSGPGTAAFGINDAGEIVGTANGDAFFYSGGGYLNFGVSGGQGAEANGVNNHDQIAGSYELSGTIIGQAFAGTPGAVSPLVPPGSAEATAYGINNAGTIVGAYDTTFHGPQHGFIAKGGAFTTFDVKGADSTAITGVNNNGELAGVYSIGGALTGFCARLEPSAVRVRIRSLSTSAKPPSTASINRPVLVLVPASRCGRRAEFWASSEFPCGVIR